MHTHPGKGGAFIKAEMKNIKTGAKHYEKLRSDATIRRDIFDEDEYVYLFTEENIVYLMHPSNYEQIVLELDLLGEKKAYMQDSIKIKVVKKQSLLSKGRLLLLLISLQFWKTEYALTCLDL